MYWIVLFGSGRLVLPMVPSHSWSISLPESHSVVVLRALGICHDYGRNALVLVPLDALVGRDASWYRSSMHGVGREPQHNPCFRTKVAWRNGAGRPTHFRSE